MRKNWAVIFLVGGLILSGCASNEAEKKTGQQKSESEKVDLPPNFPKDAPI